MSAAISRLNLPIAILAAAIVLGLAYDGAVLVNHLQPAANQTSSHEPEKSEPAHKTTRAKKPAKPAKQRPCSPVKTDARCPAPAPTAQD